MASFLDLPGELRNNIYSIILSDIFSQTASPPWQAFQSPQLYLSLLLCNKQLNNEVKSLFSKLYASNATGITLYCDNISTLMHYLNESEKITVLKDANFIIRDIRLGGTSPGSDHWMLRLLKSQPGFRGWWLERNKAYRAKPIYRQMFEERDFIYTEVEDSTGRLNDGGTRLGYEKLLYPRLKNGCRITAFTWITRAYWGYEFEVGSMVLEGKLGDLVLEREDETMRLRAGLTWLTGRRR